MFSGIHSMLFGKKHHKHKTQDDSESKSYSLDEDFVILERRHSGDFDKSTGLYPNLDPTGVPQSNLPYLISPSLPNLPDAVKAEEIKEEFKVDLLQGVPFVLSMQLQLLDEDHEKNFKHIITLLNNFKESEEETFQDYSYDYEIEHSVFTEFSTEEEHEERVEEEEAEDEG